MLLFWWLLPSTSICHAHPQAHASRALQPDRDPTFLPAVERLDLLSGVLQLSRYKVSRGRIVLFSLGPDSLLDSDLAAAFLTTWGSAILKC